MEVLLAWRSTNPPPLPLFPSLPSLLVLALFPSRFLLFCCDFTFEEGSAPSLFTADESTHSVESFGLKAFGGIENGLYYFSL